jgi:hypothetical protein
VIPYNDALAVEFGLACNDVYTESAHAPDPGQIAVKSSRASYDYYVGRLPWPDAKRKHLNDLRRINGLKEI